MIFRELTSWSKKYNQEKGTNIGTNPCYEDKCMLKNPSIALMVTVSVFFSSCDQNKNGSMNKALKAKEEASHLVVERQEDHNKPEESHETGDLNQSNNIVNENQKSDRKLQVATLKTSVGELSDEKTVSVAAEDFILKADVKNNWIILNKGYLEKDFLLRLNVISSGNSPRFEGKKGRVVYFIKKNKNLLMLERNEGHTNYEELSPSLIISSYPIEHQTESEIAINFSKGTKELLTPSDWYAQEGDGSRHHSTKDRYKGVPVKDVYIERMFELPSIENALQINVKAREYCSEAKAYIPVEARFLLQFYQKNPKFVPTKSEFAKNDTGYFEVEPFIDEEQKHITLATKFDINKPIVFAISHNTPAEYRDAIKAGVLYWNKAFGKEVVKVVDAPEGEEAPNYERNIIQWINWKKAGFAYADAQMDPRTGEILNAQIFLTSAFAINSKKRAKRAIQALDELIVADKTTEESFDFLKTYGRESVPVTREQMNSHIASEHSHHGHMCQHHMSKGFVASYENLLEAGVSESKMLEVARLYLLIVTAHEVGHTLGLRHNFAGSLHSPLTQQEKNENFEALVKGQALPHNKAMTSSVMDYLTFKEDVVAAYQMMHGEKAFDYDVKAIRKLYYHDESIQEERDPLFCTDSHTWKYSDCKRFFSGKDPFTHTKEALKTNFKELAPLLASHMFSAMENSTRQDMVNRNVFSEGYLFGLAIHLLNPVWNSLMALTDFSDSLQSQVKYGESIDWSKVNHNKENHLKWTYSALEAHEKFSNIVSFESLFDEAKIAEKFSQYLVDEFDSADDNSDLADRKKYYLDHRDEINQHLLYALKRLRKKLEKLEVLQLLYTYYVSDEPIEPHGVSLSDVFSNYSYIKARDYIMRADGFYSGTVNFKFHYELPAILKAIIPEDKRQDFVEAPKGVEIDYLLAHKLSNQKITNIYMQAAQVFSTIYVKQQKEQQQKAKDFQDVLKKLFQKMKEAQEKEAQEKEVQNPSADENAVVSQESNNEPEISKEEILEAMKKLFEGKGIKVTDSEPTMGFDIYVPVNIKKPSFYYSNEVRFLATFLLSPYKNQNYTFAATEREALEQDFDAFLERYNEGLPISRVDLSVQDRKTAKWFAFNRKLQSSLSTKVRVLSN